VRRLTSRHIVDSGFGLTLHLGVVESKESHCTPALGTSHLYGRKGSGNRSEIFGEAAIL